MSVFLGGTIEIWHLTCPFRKKQPGAVTIPPVNARTLYN